jgi:excisionase family DNA binding protein
MRKRGYLLISEAARKLGRPNQTLYRWIEEGKVVGFREGYRRYVKWGSVLKHLGPQAAEMRGLRQKDVYVETGLDD